MTSRLRFLILSLMAFGLCLAVCGRVVAQELDASLNETVVNVPKKGAVFTVDLETTVYKPDGDGPFPLVVINHGKAYGDSRFQSRYQCYLA